ncbi:MAG: hypothetical protein ACRDPA_33720 [Solirubrobacteraceae bacterium]
MTRSVIGRRPAAQLARRSPAEGFLFAKPLEAVGADALLAEGFSPALTRAA